MSNRFVTGAALIALIREFHKDCDGCPVEQLCDEYEAALGGNVVLLSEEQSTEMRNYLGRIVNHPAIFGPAQDVHDDAYSFMDWFPFTKSVQTPSEPKA